MNRALRMKIQLPSFCKFCSFCQNLFPPSASKQSPLKKAFRHQSQSSTQTGRAAALQVRPVTFLPGAGVFS
jgi:hypothetical protein